MKNYKQLQEAYDQGYYDQLNEDPAGLFRVLKKAIGIGTGAGKRVVRTDIPAGVIPSRFNWGSNQGWLEFLELMGEIMSRKGKDISHSTRYRALVMFISNPTVRNLQELNRLLGQWDIILRANNDGILELHGVLMPSNPNYPWMSAIRNLFLEWNIPWPPPGP